MQRSPSPAVFYAIFFLSGVSVMVLSVLLPQLAVADSAAANMVAAQFVGQLLGPFAMLRSTRLSLVLGLMLSSVAAAALAWVMLPPLWLLLFYGLGMGITMTATNLLAGEEARPEQRASRIEMLNAFWPLGAACASFCVGLVRRPGAVYWLIAAATSVGLVAVLLHRRVASDGEAKEEVSSEGSFAHLVRLSLLALLAVGLESSLSNWSPTFSARVAGGQRAAGIASTLFWVGILSGRTVASFLLKRIRWSTFALGCTALSIGATAALAASSGRLVYCLIFVAALGAAPIYPVIIARCLHLRGRSVVFVSAGVGSAALPWVIGTLSTHVGSLRWSLLVSTVAALLLFGALLREQAGAHGRSA